MTGTSLSGLHHKERWLAFGASLAEGETIEASAARRGIAPSTAHRRRHRFLAAVRQAPDRLAGIVEADEAFVLVSRKGKRKLGRKLRWRGGKAKKRALSREQVPILVAADRGGETLSHTLTALNAVSVKDVLGAGPRSGRAACLRRRPLQSACRGGARRPSREHQRLGWRAGACALHIQTVNSRHSQIKGFLRARHGIATKYLDSYLRWLHLIELGDQPSPRVCLEAAMTRPYLRFAN